MAQSYTTQDGITLHVPNTYVSTVVKAGAGNVAAAGVVTLIGEADEGPAWVDEPIMDTVAYTPDSAAEVRAKYGSGNLVEAFSGLVAASGDPAIVGGVSLVRMIKTNRSLAAKASIVRSGLGEYATLTARREGKPGNLIKYKSEIAISEVAPRLEDIVYVPHYLGSPVAFGLRVNGGGIKSISVAAKLKPESFCAAVEDYSKGVLCKGGEQVGLLDGLDGKTLTATYGGGLLTLTLPVGESFSGSLAVGDVVVIPGLGDYGAAAESTIAGATDGNLGSYIVVSANTTSIGLKRISAGTPENASGAVDVGELDVIGFRAVSVENATGQNRGSLVGLSGDFVATDDGSYVTLTAPDVWSAQPVEGDLCVIPATFAGVAAGFYMVVQSTSLTAKFYRISNGGFGTPATQNVALPIVAGSEPVRFEKSVVDGVGKALEIIGDVSGIFFESDGSPATGLSNSIYYSSAEYVNVFAILRGDSDTDSFESGGDVVLYVRCVEPGAVVEVDDAKMVGKVGGTTIFTAAFDQFRTVNDLASYVEAFDGWYVEVPDASFGFRSPAALDNGVFGVSGALGWPGRLKMDAAQWMAAVSGSGLAFPTLVATAGLPEIITPPKFLSGGTKAGTTSAEVVAAIDAAEDLTTNFVVPLFAQDATADIAEGATESSSTYVIDAINLYTKSHVLKMSKVKARKNRMAGVAKVGTYAEIKQAVGKISCHRVGMAFQQVIGSNLDGEIVAFQPWMAAIKAIGMQAAGGYKGIVKKLINISGVIDPVGFKSGKMGDQEKALKDGLLIIEKVRTGGFRWVSDQLTYSLDANFVYNSMQAVYLADLMALTMIDRFDRLVVGHSVADISAVAGMSILETEMFNFLRLKWIAPSSDAPKGFKNASVKLQGGVMVVAVEVKLAGLIYFVPITFAISEVTQSA